MIAKIAAALYTLWGLLHLVAAYKVSALGQTLEQGLLQARIYQGA